MLNQCHQCPLTMSYILPAAVSTVGDCRKGEELTFEYREQSNRNDLALLHHFFLNERRPARMCAYDLPRALQEANTQQPFTDADYAPGGCLCTMVGVRLQALALDTCTCII